MNPLIANLRAHGALEDDDAHALISAFAPQRVVSAGTEIVHVREDPGHSTVLLRGHAVRAHVNPGGRRSITALHIAGDFVDLHSLELLKLDHSVAALTDCSISSVRHAALEELVTARPALRRILWRSTLIDAAIQRTWLALALGGDAETRTAHLFCEMFVRMRIVGLTEDLSYPLPLSQQALGEVTGMSTVHMNRVLRLLRDHGAAIFAKGVVRIQDWEKLCSIAGFDPTYLNLDAGGRVDDLTIEQAYRSS